MNFFIADDDEAIQSMLTDIIEDYDMGKVVGTSTNGENITSELLSLSKVDILIIDLLMPMRDGIETIKNLGSKFNGKIIMLSQVEDKEIIGEAYSLGIEYYITKPINKLEVINIIGKLRENIKLEKSIHDIKSTLNVLDIDIGTKDKENFSEESSINNSGKFLLTELGIIGENGSNDLLDILNCLSKNNNAAIKDFPALKDIFSKMVKKRLGKNASAADIKKEIKASEQRIRRAISQSMTHLASLGLIDYSNQKFEEYSSKFFDFEEIRKRMLELENAVNPSKSHVKINMRKFIKVFFIESRNLGK